MLDKDKQITNLNYQILRYLYIIRRLTKLHMLS